MTRNEQLNCHSPSFNWLHAVHYLILVLRVFLDITKNFIHAYDRANRSFVETNLTAKCTRKLEESGLVILTGQQGCGKTLTAVHIMTHPNYKDWIKRKFTSWEDFLAFDLDQQICTLIYVDNIFDGYMYRHELQRWWSSLCYFYFKYIWKKETIRLLITAKDNVIEIACAHIKENVQVLEKMFIVKAESESLTFTERLVILEMQVKIAKESKGIPEPCITQNLKNVVKNHDCEIGFPLCAHLYAFEDQKDKKGSAILVNPRAYVRDQIANEINKNQNDADGVKTLLLFLLLYLGPNGSNPYEKLDLIYKDECIEALEKKGLKTLLEKMKPLNFNSLDYKAKELEEKVLIKHTKMYEFKHQVYLEGVVDYFYRKNFEIVVEHFPLDVMRTYAFLDTSINDWRRIIQRIKTELLQNALSEALSCKIFEEEAFQEEFCKELQTENALDKLILILDKSSSFPLPLIFWAYKYRLRKLSRFLWNFAEKNHGFQVQFYIAAFGECCSNDENYITLTPSTLNEKCLLNLSNSDGNNILYILISSDKSDSEVHCFLTKIFQNLPEQWNGADARLLNCALTHPKCSRLACILEILHQRSVEIDEIIKTLPTIVKVIQKHQYTALWELECLARICIVLAYDDRKTKSPCVEITSIESEYCHLRALFEGKADQQFEMTRIIKICMAKCPKSSTNVFSDNFETKTVQNEKRLSQDFLKAIKRAIKLQSKSDAF